MKPVITSLLETDLYKFTMWQALLHSHPDSQTEYRFVCRNTPAYPLADLQAEVERELDHLCTLQLTEAELDYLRSLRYIKSDFTDFLALFHFQRKFIRVSSHGDELEIVATGPQVHVMGFEIYVLRIVNELYFRRLQTAATLVEARRRLADKITAVRVFAQEPPRLHPFEFFDFGLRRSFSAAWQEEVVASLAKNLPQFFKGTSNVWLAKKYQLVPIGTMAHEYLQSYQSFGVRLRDFQTAALEGWVHEYRGDLGTALTDVVGMDAFLADFDLYFAKLFDGLRHDSGDPVIWGEKALAHYAQLRIDAHTKRLVFSDGLDLPRAFALYRHFADRSMTGFGIGTNLSNDTGLEALNIVMKLTVCNGQPVAKLSDSPGKTLCTDQTFLAYLRQVFGHKL
ncbi:MULTISPECIES: nicotinate phosphoribosyltransferase [unclassified Undibacterium]|uniref:nicotinate phosphoribosyltransferase n=1 Tax=unclassified Undibacterium TaxID=2630295 RepID=UPI002AC9678A|nr:MULTISPECIES: nicotinate phosphoribosyltransferase [unclassified Undibacterium]MEB0138882.1 nicotinate phosphoribosyltransferase [Undibacterium sp. CCC2.1]MEB0174084.1 nicotinate phosphoribosyltransferase [Undibacterium sp. CCC1.1]MEB0178044.1 nicotinate phosphoribosyltransferase [Undibacterium sp. CCC3.4]MEB0217260.1 nicotinate phosphoribosyltransferase [Undibacterium sp. 5I2]WPX44732.1 nicotinate phosphoribosyltransferase [Undibacterium sp. CCC3.4]